MKLLLIALLVLGNTQWITSYEAFQTEEFDSLDGWVIQNQFEATTDIITKCSGKNIIGGLKTFGTKSTATKLIKIPPHYKLKFNLQLWKIGEWENDVFSAYVDGVPWEMKWGFTEGGIRLCGGSESKNSDKVFDVEFEILHNSPTVTTVLATSSKGKADVQAWGFRQIKISFIPCPSDCGICHNDKVQECKHWNQEALSWFHVDTKLEGWKLENGKPKGYECSGIVIFGGYENIGAKALLSNTFTNIVPHSKVMVKFTFWKIDLWDNEEFYVKIDDKQVQKLAFQKTDGIDLCGAQQLNPGYGEKIVSIEIIQKHSSPTLTISFTTSLKNDPDEQSWGVRDFFLFAAQCTKFCDECVGTAENECTKCQPTHTLQDGKCINKNEWYILSKEFFTDDQFNKIDGWTFQDVDPAGPNPPITKCGDLGLVGGYQAFGKKATVQKVFKLPKHDFVRIKATVYKIDQWDGEELTMFVDNQEFWSQFLGWNDPGQSDICGNQNGSWKERIINIDKIIAHSQSELTVDFKSTLQKTADEASWGFREFLLLYSPLKECIEVFSECNYKGQSSKICDNVESLKDAQIEFDIKSIKIPEGLKITGFKNPGFKGDRVEYETNQECIDKIEFSLIQKKYEIYKQMIDQYENNPTFWNKFSFAGGPTQLPRSVLHKLEKQFIQPNGKSILELSKYDHEYHQILDQAINDLQSLLDIPNQYKIIFCQGGASLLFEAIPMNLMKTQHSSISYTNTGYWSSKALEEAQKFCQNVNIATNIAQDEFGKRFIPELEQWNINKEDSYLHYCDNETVEGLEYQFIPKFSSVPIVTDMSSNFLTKPLDWSKLDLVYAHAQKNIGIAGSTLMIIKPELINNHQNIPYMWDFKEMIKKQSLISNLPIFPIYVNTLVFDWIKKQGTLDFWDQYCKKRSQQLYKIIDNSHGVYINQVKKEQRSRINITFTLKDEIETNKFIELCKNNNIIEVKGHRAIGGCRICLYLPIPQIGIDKLSLIMEDFMN